MYYLPQIISLFYFHPILFYLKTYIIFHKQTYFQKSYLPQI